MELLSFAPLLAAAPDPESTPSAAIARIARQLLAPPSDLSLTSAVVVLLASVLCQILACWIAAKVVVGNEKGTLARAAHLWLLSLLVGIGMAVLLAIGLAAAAATQQPVLLVVSASGWAFLAFLLALLLPAKVFETDLLRSFGILVLSAILVLAGQTALHRALGQPTLVRWQPLQRIIADSPEGRQRRLKHLLAGDQIAVIENELDRLSLPEARRKPFSKRQEELQAVLVALDAQRKLLKADDPAALADHNALRQRHDDLVKQMRADYTESLAPPAAR